jgi:hypothetical protein
MPISRSSWWAGVKSGLYPKPVKLSPGVTAWRVEDVRALIQRLGGTEQPNTTGPSENPLPLGNERIPIN